MTAKGVSMRKLKEVLRLHFDLKLSQHQIAKALNLSSGVVNKYLKRATATGIKSWPLPAQFEDETALESFLRAPVVAPIVSCSPKQDTEKDSIDFTTIHQEMKRKGMTLQLLYEELVLASPTVSISYSHLSLLYRKWKDKLPRSMRQIHVAGDKVFVDYAGQTISIIDPDTNQVREAQVFIGVLGCSNFTYSESTWTQTLPDWISSHRRMFEFFGGVPALVVPDNLLSGVTKACRYEPDINQTYAQFIEHYGTAVMPARPYKPKDKAKAEVGVQIVERWIIARLRHKTFVGLGELNSAIYICLESLNTRPFKRLPGSRQSAFEELDKPNLRELPIQPYLLQHFKKVRINIDYHFELERHYYSVPHEYCKEQVEVWYTRDLVNCYFRGKSIATHERSYKAGAHTTTLEHMPKSHQKHLEWTPERFMNWGKDIGPNTLLLVIHLLENRPHPEQGYRSCLGLLGLAKKYSKERLDKACRQAIELGAKTRKSVASILQHNLEEKPIYPESTLKPNIPEKHENLRGPNYYY